MADRTTYVRIKGDITDLQGKLRKGQNDLRGFADTTSKSIQKNRSEWGATSTQIGLMGTSLIGLSALAVKGFAGFDKSLSAISAQGGEAAARIDDLRQAAIRAGADTQYSAAEAADAITDLAKAGLSVSDILGGGLAGALSLAAAGEMDVKSAAEATATALMQFGLKGSEAGHVADLLAAGANKAMGEVSDLSMALSQGGLVAHQTGLSIDETAAALSAFAQQGLLGSDAGTSLKAMLQRLTPQSAEAQKMMTSLGISAYDSQGEFVGLANFAGQLREKLSTLTPAARSSALGVMFGSDAVRAAGVLYSEGSEGIQEWTDQVSDAGFAARQAAVLTDNLSGDLERLSGSLDTVAIQSGSGLNDALRGMTQNATGLVNAIGEIPAPVLSGVASLTALSGAILVGSSILMKGVGAWSDYREGMEQMRQDAPAAAAGISKVSKAAKAAAVALAALQVASIFGSSMQAGLDKTHATLADTAEALAHMAQAGSGIEKLDAQFSQVDGAVRGVGGAISGLSQIQGNWFLGAVYGLDSFVAGLTGVKSHMTMVGDQLTKVDQALTQMDPTQAAKAFAQIRTAAEAQGVSLTDLLHQFPEYRATLQSTAVQLGQTSLTTEEYADWMSGKVPAAVKMASAAHPELVDKLNDTQQAAIGASASVSDYAKALWESANQALALSGSTIGYKAMLDDTAAATKKLVEQTKNKKDLTDLDTKAGREAQSTLDKIASTTITHTQKLIEQGKSQKDVTKSMEAGRKAFHDQAKAMGFTEDQIASMISEYGMVPASVTTDMSVTGTGLANKQLDTLKSSIKGLPKSAQTKVLSAFNSDGIDGAYEALDDIDGETADAWIDSLLNRGGIQEWEKAHLADKHPKIYPKLMQDEFVIKFNAQRQGGPKLAGGGPVWGVGTETSDSIPAMLSNNEHVWEASAVRGAGGHGQVARLRALARAGMLPAFASGGPATLSDWQGELRSPLELTRLQIQIRDLTSDLAERETYNPKGKRKKAKRYKLRGLDRTEAQQELAEAKADLALARQAAALNASKAGTIEQQIAAMDTANERAGQLRQVYDSVSSGLNGFDLSGSLASTQTQHTDAAGNIWYTEQAASGASIAAAAKAKAARTKDFAGKLTQLRKLGMSAAVLQDIAGLGVDEGIKAANAFLTDRSQIATMNAAYDALASASGAAGQAVTESMYAGGLSAAEGMVAGLTSQLDTVGKKLASALVSALGSGASLPARAAGGPVTAGHLYQVNERGVEMFRPAVSGVILTAAQTQQAVGSSGPATAYLTDAQMAQLAQAVVSAASRITTMAAAEQVAAARYALPGGGI